MSAGDGDGWVRLPDGSRRWGRYGASGLLLHSEGTGNGSGGHVLLQLRAVWGHMGGTWGMPGGALDSGESPVQAALREFGEEVAGDLGEVALNGVHRQDHEVWRYDTVLAHAAHRADFAPGNAESTAIRWVAIDEVERLRLLGPFRDVWPQLRAALAQRLELVVDGPAVLRHRQGEEGETGTGYGGVEAARRLRDELADLAAAGVDGAVLPAALPLAPLHRWFPRVRLVVDAAALPLPSVPGVEVVMSPGHGDGADDGGRRPSLNGAHAAGTLVVTAPSEVGGRRGSATVVPPEWLAGAAGATRAVR
ncbi:hypothetical protein GCM10009799_47660 [Nocardiopsis rhodophaea]|uniref:Nudix hydrolase domain-containing protein n=1 Tax=Nocardiopsis rhodophaea TaxID=280238 RepID=A0ABN2TM28_9ACTN